MSIIDIRQIMQILPHRYPLLLIDRIIELEPLKRAVGYKNVTVNEPFFQGHFPNNPLMPGVYMIEALAQLGGTAILSPGDFSSKTPYLAAIEKAKFRRPVIPGDQLMMEVEVVKTRKNIGWVSAVAKVDGVLACSTELAFSIVEDPRAFVMDAAVLHA